MGKPVVVSIRLLRDDISLREFTSLVAAAEVLTFFQQLSNVSLSLLQTYDVNN